MLCEGTDFRGVSSAFELDSNAEIASQIGAPILLVANARAKKLRPDLKIEGPIQYDAVADASVVRTKLPVNGLSRGCTITDITNTVVITAIQSQVRRTRS